MLLQFRDDYWDIEEKRKKIEGAFEALTEAVKEWKKTVLFQRDEILDLVAIRHKALSILDEVEGYISMISDIEPEPRKEVHDG